MKLKFNQDAFYNGKLEHEKGSIKDIDNSLGMATRWLKRGIAEEVTGKVEVKKEEIKEEIKEEVKEELVEEVKEEPKKKSKKNKEE